MATFFARTDGLERLLNCLALTLKVRRENGEKMAMPKTKRSHHVIIRVENDNSPLRSASYATCHLHSFLGLVVESFFLHPRLQNFLPGLEKTAHAWSLLNGWQKLLS